MSDENIVLMDTTKLLSESELPVNIPDKILLTEGTWNNDKYTSEEIEQAYLNTDWSNKSNYSLYLDHQDTQEQGVGNWVGYVENIRLSDDKKLIGDLKIWDDKLALYINEAKAKFGISATLRGSKNEKTDKMSNFKFESFSVVTNPACKEAFINLSQKDELAKVTDFETERKKRGMSVSSFYAVPKDPPSSSKLPIFDKSHTQNAMARFNQTDFENDDERAKAKRKIISNAKKFGINVSEKFIKLGDYDYTIERRVKIITMEEEEKKQEENTEVEKTEEVESVKSEESSEVKENAEEDKDKKDEEEEKPLSEMGYKELAEYSKFVSKFAKENPAKNLNDANKAWSVVQKQSSELNSLSDAELHSKISEMHEVLKSRNLLASKETSEDKIERLSNTVRELQDKLKEPTMRKTLSTVPGKAKSVDVNVDKSMADFILDGGQGSFTLD